MHAKGKFFLNQGLGKSPATALASEI